jgi:Holliday junction resolvasome RuvABC endonuclease subunit
MRDVILGLDVSSTSTGFCVLKRGRFTKSPKDFGVISPDKNLSLGEKLVFFRDSLQRLLEKYKPTKVVIEDVFIRHKSVVVLLSRFSGVAIEVCTKAGLEPELLTATEVRAVFGLKNKKELAFQYIVDRYKLDWTFNKYNDIADSLLLALAFRKISNDRPRGKTEKTKRVTVKPGTKGKRTRRK